MLEKINQAADRKAAELEKVNYDKYYDIYKVAIQFFRRAPVLMYGGLALNDIMPRDYKFYPKYTLPDIDVFCTNGEEIAKRLIAEYERRGYKIPAYKEALHPGTWKVFAEGLQVADISDVPPPVYRILAKHSRRGSLGIRIVNRQFLRMSLHVMLSQPYDAHRWTKVFQRLISFYTIYPPSDFTRELAYKNEVVAESNKAVYAALPKELIVFGLDKIGLYLDKQNGDYPVKVICDELPSTVAETIIANLTDKTSTRYTYKLYPGNMLVNDHAIIYNGRKQIIAEIYKADMCLSYINYSGMRYASLHTLLRMYISFTLSPFKHHKKYAGIYKNVIDQLTYIQIKQSAEPSRRKLLNQFPIECYGTQPGLITLRRNQIERIIK